MSHLSHFHKAYKLEKLIDSHGAKMINRINILIRYPDDEENE